MQMEFVAGVSHELRTPLTVVRTAAYNLTHSGPTDPARVQQYGALIQTEAERLSRIVEEVLGFSKAQAGRAIGPVAPVSVERVIDEAISDSRTAPERHLEPGLPPVLADEHALKHALENLLSNAAKYGGDWIGVSARANGSRVEIAVADRGQGIAADELTKIFEPFYRGRRAVSDQIHGTGLGLSLVKRIVEAHNGTVSVRSSQGNGVEFVIAIPAAHEAAHSAG
jgi:signal transduction histidine kinase